MKLDAGDGAALSAAAKAADVDESNVPEPVRTAFEIKFLVDDGRAAEVERWAGEHLARDAHADPSGAYHTTSLYCDTPELDVYRRAGWYGRRKFRIRRYGDAQSAYLERKARSGNRVAKRRSSISLGELPLLALAENELTWAGDWFQRRLAQRRLSPACQISYDRTAYVGAGADAGLRLTLDRNVQGTLADRWTFTNPIETGQIETAPTAAVRLLAGLVILELKFQHSLPVRFKQLIERMQLAPRGVSKYRLCQDAHRPPSLAAEGAGA